MKFCTCNGECSNCGLPVKEYLIEIQTPNLSWDRLTVVKGKGLADNIIQSHPKLRLRKSEA